MNDIAIRVENLGKRYRIGKAQQQHDTLRDAFAAACTARATAVVCRPPSAVRWQHPAANDDQFWALKDVSFEVKRGEVVGIIGRNGAGKITLLKILSRITEPTEGRAEIHGRVGSLLEVGTGFHPELTGRENIYLNGAILGMSRAEIDRKFDEIVDFSGVEKFIDTPVKRYSSRDERAPGLCRGRPPGAGDPAGGRGAGGGGCGVSEEVPGQDGRGGREGRTVLFVSHNMGAIIDLCRRTLCLTEGKLSADGYSSEVVRAYLDYGSSKGEVDLRDWAVDRLGSGPMRVTYLAARNSSGQPKSEFSHGEQITFDMEVLQEAGTACIMGVSIRDSLGNVVLHLNNTDDKAAVVLPSRETRIQVQPALSILNDGAYYVTIWLGDSLNTLHDRAGNCLRFTVDSTTAGIVRSQGLVRVPAQWTVIDVNDT